MFNGNADLHGPEGERYQVMIYTRGNATSFWVK